MNIVKKNKIIKQDENLIDKKLIHVCLIKQPYGTLKNLLNFLFCDKVKVTNMCK